jgi:hypothetical protein
MILKGRDLRSLTAAGAAPILARSLPCSLRVGADAGGNAAAVLIGMRELCALIFAACAWMPCNARASDPEPSKPPVVYAKKTRIDFSNVAIEGFVQRPSIVYVDAHRAARFKSLIRVRGSFLPELQASEHQL